LAQAAKDVPAIGEHQGGNSCLVVLSLEAQTSTTVVGGRQWKGTIEYLRPTSTEATVYSIAVEETPLGMRANLSETSPRTHRFTCQHAQKLDAPAASLQEAYALVQNIGVPPGHLAELRIERQMWLVDDVEAGGIHMYTWSYTPDWIGNEGPIVSYRPYSHSVNPHLGHLQFSVVAPES
jgi:hypothetical protein